MAFQPQHYSFRKLSTGLAIAALSD
ncbi:YSIRK-type signal peptide-containing protein [Mucilaginibacter sp. AW1-7]